MTSDGTKALSGYSDGSIDLWDLSSGNHLRTLKGPQAKIACLQTNENLTRIFSSDCFGTIQVWNPRTGKCLQTLQAGHVGRNTGLQISADETTAFSSYFNGTMKIWNLPKKKLLQTLQIHPHWSQCPHISADGRAALSESSELLFTFVDLAPLPHKRVYEVSMACLRNDPDTVKKFQNLPLFVQKAVTAYSDERKRKATGGNPNSYGGGFNSVANARLYRGLCKYSKAIFLPGIIELFEQVNSGVADACFAEAAHLRFNFLPQEIKDLVYWKLCKIHRAAGKLLPRKPAPKGYGEQAFNPKSGYPTTNEERIMALKSC
jgi:hypothetical protein